ncbi:MAG: hydrogenase expression protein [Synergistaceae bacterium]|nr:hydrogenase expression protein [Synergistaceae bacterium]
MPGKLQPDILKKSVLDFTGALREDLIVGGGIGEDAALIKVPEGILAAASDPVTGATKNAGKLLVHINANDLACKGADPAWLVVTLIVPDKMGVPFISEIMSEIHETCKKLNIAIAGGHTELTSKYSEPVISGTMLGITRHELSAKKIKNGDFILATGHAGLEGMSIIANDRDDLFAEIFKPDEIKIIKSWGNDFSVVKPARILRDYARYMHDPTEGGLNGALYEIQAGADLRIEIYNDDIPVSDLTLRAASELNFDYMNLISSGMLVSVIAPEKIEQARQALKAENIDSRIIGKFKDGEKIYLNTHEELWRILNLDVI